MEFRYLGSSGLKVSAVSYGNWVTHGSQVEADQATACVRAALEAGITTFDTADVYANGAAETFFDVSLRVMRRQRLADLIPSDSPAFALVDDVRRRGSGKLLSAISCSAG